MEDCIFCKIVAGKMPCYKVFENEKYIAFLDIFPTVKGHTLVIPKEHYQWTYEVPNFGEYWDTALEVTKKLQNTLKPKWVSYFTHGAIPHAHIHILPRTEEIKGGEVLPRAPISISKEELQTLVDTINS